MKPARRYRHHMQGGQFTRCPALNETHALRVLLRTLHTFQVKNHFSYKIKDRSPELKT